MRVKVNLQGVAETLLMPLWARACETKRINGRLIYDPLAVKLVQELDYDFHKFEHAKLFQTGTAVRSEILDRETKTFINRHPDAVCINLACGLDTRFYRVDNSRIEWYNLDCPEVIKLRETLLQESDSRIHELAFSMLDSQRVHLVQTQNRPVLFIMEGASLYFSAEQMKLLFSLIQDFFPRAGLLLEIMTPYIISLQKHYDSVSKSQALFIWGVSDGRKIEKLNPHLRFREQWDLYEYHRFRWGWLGLLSLVPWCRDSCSDKIVYLEMQDN